MYGTPSICGVSRIWNPCQWIVVAAPCIALTTSTTTKSFLQTCKNGPGILRLILITPRSIPSAVIHWDCRQATASPLQQSPHALWVKLKNKDSNRQMDDQHSVLPRLLLDSSSSKGQLVLNWWGEKMKNWAITTPLVELFCYELLRMIIQHNCQIHHCTGKLLVIDYEENNTIYYERKKINYNNWGGKIDYLRAHSMIMLENKFKIAHTRCFLRTWSITFFTHEWLHLNWLSTIIFVQLIICPINEIWNNLFVLSDFLKSLSLVFETHQMPGRVQQIQNYFE